MRRIRKILNHIVHWSGNRCFESQTELQDFIDNLSCPSAKIGLDGSILLANKAAIARSQYPEDAFMNMSFLDGPWWKFDPQVHARVKDAFQIAIQGKRVTYEERFKRRDDRIDIINLMLTPVFNSENHVVYLLAEAYDITLKKQGEEKLRKARDEAENANRAKDFFLATLSHELRTPVTTMLSWAQMLRMGTLSPANTKRGIEAIERSAKAQGQLINDLLEVSRIILDKLPLEAQYLDPAAVILTTLDSVRPIIENKCIQIDTLFEPLDGTIYADPARLQQIFWNLLTNAIKFSKKGSKISVHLFRPNDDQSYVYISIADRGIGIEPSFLPYIFDPFSQADSSNTRRYGGLGLGLAIVSKLVKLHGGSIWAESPGKGLGSTFTVRFPFQCCDKLLNPKSISQELLTSMDGLESLSKELSGLRILIVDDELSASEAFGLMMTTFGAVVKTTSSVKEALKALESFKPNALLSDIAMPEQDGYSLIRQIRSLPPERGGCTPAIALTSCAGTDDAKQALAAGFQAHVAKPVDIINLARVITGLALPNQ